jgi:hypothetical protein
MHTYLRSFSYRLQYPAPCCSLSLVFSPLRAGCSSSCKCLCSSSRCAQAPSSPAVRLVRPASPWRFFLLVARQYLLCPSIHGARSSLQLAERPCPCSPFRDWPRGELAAGLLGCSLLARCPVAVLPARLLQLGARISFSRPARLCSSLCTSAMAVCSSSLGPCPRRTSARRLLLAPTARVELFYCAREVLCSPQRVELPRRVSLFRTGCRLRAES